MWNNFTSLQTDPVEYVENMCENMQLYPLQDFLTGDQLLFEYKPEVRRFPFLNLLLEKEEGEKVHRYILNCENGENLVIFSQIFCLFIQKYQKFCG